MTSLRKYHISFLFLIFLFAFLGYLNIFNGEFIFDDASIDNNLAIKDFEYFKNLGIEGYLGNAVNGGRPVVNFTFAINYSIGGLDPFGYHIGNFLIHLANSFLVYILIYKTLQLPVSAYKEDSHWISFLTTIFFSLHPIQTGAVSYIVQRAEILSSFFYLLGLLLFIKGLSDTSLRGHISYFAGIICFLLGLGSKEIIITLPFVLSVYWLYFLRDVTNRKMQTAKIGILLLPTMSMIFYKIYLIRHTPNARIGPGSDFGSYEYLLTQFRVITKYIALLFFPINQNFDYDFAISKGFLSPQSTLFSFIVFLYLMVTVFLLYKRWRLFSFAILWFFIILAPTSGIIPITEVIMEHRVYLASVGFFLLFAIGLYHIYTSFLRGHESGFAILAILILMMSLTYLTTKRNMVWTNTIAFWEDVVKKSPLNVRPHIALGIAYHEKGFNDLAINEYSKATALADDREKPNSMLALALLYAESGRDKEALLEMDKSLKLNPEKTPDLYYVIGMIYALTGYWEEAVKNYKNALNQNPNFVVARYEMGNLYRVKRLYDNALSEYIEILKIDPNSAKAYNDMGVVYGEIGMFDEAERNYLLALKLNPKFSSAIKNLKTVVELKNEKFKK